ncbi:MAG TPA: GWxTD domain-containing protein [Bacteroidales bacterium]|nr:GWxTD domain-containing protein [Bacteroidales bacterium]
MFRSQHQIAVLITLLFFGCTAPVRLPKERNVAKIYNPSSTKIHPAFMVFHENENTSLLNIKIFPKELLYSMANPEGQYKATIRVSFQLVDIENPEDNTLADSGTFAFSFAREDTEQRVIREIRIKAEQGKIYQLNIKAADIIRNEELLKYIYVDKRSGDSHQNYMIFDEKTKIPYFPPYVLGNERFRIRYNNPEKYDSIFVLYYGSEMPLPKPSFTLTREREFLSQPDSIWILPYNKNNIYQLAYEGMYFFQFDTSQAAGMTLLNFGDDFPRIKSPYDMILPLAYLTSSPEYNEIKSATNQKLAVDNFWLSCAEDMERARELIRIYYNRVFFSNYYFTSFKEGWMTDRGMIFLIYGPPQAIYTKINEEKWVYYRKNYSTAITFVFNNEQSSYADNNFILQRSESYDMHWRQAVNSWKNGQVFLLD